MIIDEPVITFTRREARRLSKLLEIGLARIHEVAPAQLTRETKNLLEDLFRFGADHASDSGRLLSLAGRPNMASEGGTRSVGAEWITTTEAAWVLGVTESRVRQIALDLDGVKFGAAWGFPRSTIEERRSKQP